MTNKKRERRGEERRGGRTMKLSIQGQVQCKSLSLVNVESGENVNKQTTAVTHSYGRGAHTHILILREGWRDGGGEQKGRAGGKQKTRGTCWNPHIDTPHENTKSPPQTNKCTAKADCFICQHSH